MKTTRYRLSLIKCLRDQQFLQSTLIRIQKLVMMRKLMKPLINTMQQAAQNTGGPP